MADNTEKPRVIVIIDDRLWRSVVRDTYTFSLLAAVTSVGYILDISALTWIGGLLWILTILGMAKQRHDNGRMTIAQAREWLDKMERGE